MTKQKSAELLARLPQAAHSGKPCPNQITHRLMGYIGYPNSAQFSSAMKSCQIVASRRSVLMLYMRLYEGISKWRGQRRAHRASRLSARPRPDLPANIPQWLPRHIGERWLHCMARVAWCNPCRMHGPFQATLRWRAQGQKERRRAAGV